MYPLCLIDPKKFPQKSLSASINKYNPHTVQPFIKEISFQVTIIIYLDFIVVSNVLHYSLTAEFTEAEYHTNIAQILSNGFFRINLECVLSDISIMRRFINFHARILVEVL